MPTTLQQYPDPERLKRLKERADSLRAARSQATAPEPRTIDTSRLARLRERADSLRAERAQGGSTVLPEREQADSIPTLPAARAQPPRSRTPAPAPAPEAPPSDEPEWIRRRRAELEAQTRGRIQAEADRTQRQAGDGDQQQVDPAEARARADRLLDGGEIRQTTPEQRALEEIQAARREGRGERREELEESAAYTAESAERAEAAGRAAHPIQYTEADRAWQAQRQAADQVAARTPVGELMKHAAVATLQGAMDMGASTVEGVGMLIDELDNLTFDVLRSGGDEGHFTAGAARAIRDAAERMELSEELKGAFLADMLPRALGSIAPFLAGGWGSRAAGMAAGGVRGARLAQSATSFGLAGTGGAGQMYREAIDAGADEETARVAGRWGVLPGMIQVVPVFGMLERMDRSGGKLTARLMHALRSGSQGAVEEALFESLGESGYNAVRRFILDQDVSLTEGMGASAGVGGAAGFVSSFLLSAVGGRAPVPGAKRLHTDGERTFWFDPNEELIIVQDQDGEPRYATPEELESLVTLEDPLLRSREERIGAAPPNQTEAEEIAEERADPSPLERLEQRNEERQQREEEGAAADEDAELAAELEAYRREVAPTFLENPLARGREVFARLSGAADRRAAAAAAAEIEERSRRVRLERLGRLRDRHLREVEQEEEVAAEDETFAQAERRSARVSPEVAGVTDFERGGLRQRLADAIDPARKARLEGARRQLRHARRKLETDELTGLGSEAAFNRARKEIDNDPAWEWIALDADGLKGINDTEGHAAGDALLQRIGAAIAQQSNRGFRPHGDELMVAVPAGQGEAIGKMIEEAVGRTPIGDTGLTAGVSFGTGQTLEQADQELLRRKDARKAEQGSYRPRAGARAEAEGGDGARSGSDVIGNEGANPESELSQLSDEDVAEGVFAFGDDFEVEWRRRMAAVKGDTEARRRLMQVYFGAQRNSHAARVERFAKDLGDLSRPVEFQHGDNVLVASRDPKGGFRITTYQTIGPVAHIELDSIEAVQKELAQSYRSAERVEGVLDQWAQTPEWAEGVETTRRIQKENEERFRASRAAPPVSPNATTAAQRNGRPLASSPELTDAVVQVAPSSLRRAPEALQYKQDVDAEGVTDELKKIRKWDRNLAGTLLVWRVPASIDPAEAQRYNLTPGEDLVVNGHHRHHLAERLGVEELDVRFIDASSVAEAREIGAIANMAEGRGTAIDAAKIFRDRGIDGAAAREYLADRGVSATGKVVSDALDLTGLEASLFRDLTMKKMKLNEGVILGRSGLSGEQQIEVWGMAQEENFTQAQLEEAARYAAAAGTEQVSQDSLFGTETRDASLFKTKVKLSSRIRQRIQKDRRFWKQADQVGRTGRLEQEGVGSIRTDRTGKQAQQAATAEELFDRFSTRSGPVSQVLTEGARRIARGENSNAVTAETYRAVQDAINEELRGIGSGRAEAARSDAPAARAGDPSEGDVQPEQQRDSTDPAQNTLLVAEPFAPYLDTPPPAAEVRMIEGAPAAESLDQEFVARWWNELARIRAKSDLHPELTLEEVQAAAREPFLTIFDTPEIRAARRKIQDLPQAETEGPEAERQIARYIDKYYGDPSKFTQNRQAYVVLGPAASGKSFVAEGPAQEQAGALVIDSDQAKAMHPLFQKGMNANGVHAYSSWAADTLRQMALEDGTNVVIPTVGKKPENIAEDLEALAAAGYDVHVILVDLPVAEATARNVKRFYEKGRFVDPLLSYTVGEGPASSYELAKNHPAVASFARVSTDVPKNQKPRILEQGKTGRGNNPTFIQVGGSYGAEAARSRDVPAVPREDGRVRDREEGPDAREAPDAAPRDPRGTPPAGAGEAGPSVVREGSSPYDLFGETKEPGGVRQGELLPEAKGPQGIRSAQQEAAQVASLLEGKVRRGAASPSEVDRYRLARQVLDFQKAMSADDLARLRGENETSSKKDDDTQDLFAALEAEGPYFVAAPSLSKLEAAGQATLEFGSPAEKKKVAQEIMQRAGEFADVAMPGVPSLAERTAAVNRAAAPSAWVEATGKRVGDLYLGRPDPRKVHQLLSAYRTPEAEFFHTIVLDRDGKILSHRITTSGARGAAQVPTRDIGEAARLAKKVGGSVLLSHNHPSGNPKPSGEQGDIGVTKRVAAFLDKMGARFAGHVVIDHTKGSLILGDGSYETYEIQDAVPGVDPDWTEVRGRKLQGTADMVELARSIPSDARRLDVLLLDHQNQVLAFEARPMEDLDTLNDWADQVIDQAGAAYMVLGTHDAAVYLKGIRLVNDLRFEAAQRVLDVVDSSSIYGRSAYQAGAINTLDLTDPLGFDRVLERRSPYLTKPLESAVQLESPFLTMEPESSVERVARRFSKAPPPDAAQISLVGFDGTRPTEEAYGFPAARAGGKVKFAWKRAMSGKLFYQGSADVLQQFPQTRALAKAIRRHVDLEQKYSGIVDGPIERVLAGMKKKERTLAFSDFEAYMRAREGEADRAKAAALYDQMPASSRALLDAWMDVADASGRVNRRLNVRVRDPKTGRPRLIGYLGRDYFPRKMKKEIDEILRDPAGNMERWQEMKYELLANGNISKIEEADHWLRVNFNMALQHDQDFFGSVDRARTAKAPASWYDYSWDTATEFRARWPERIAQIEAFGQKVLPDDTDAFEKALLQTHDEGLQDYIRMARAHAYNEHTNGAAAKVAMGFNMLATGLHLGHPLLAGLNYVSAKGMTTFTYGFGPALEAELEMRRRGWEDVKLDAIEAGIIRTELTRIIYNEDIIGMEGLRRFTDGAMKWGGYTPAELRIRAHNWLTARAFLRQALGHWRKNPNSRASEQYRAFFEREGFDVEALMKEDGSGEVTESFERQAVRLVQGSYRYDQVPLWSNSQVGRFLFKYWKFGTQQNRLVARHIIAPLLGKGGGPRDIKPFLRFMGLMVLMGEGWHAFREYLWGLERHDASWGEIARTMDDSTARSLSLVAERMVNDLTVIGGLGLAGTPIQLSKDYVNRRKFRNPLDPPGLSAPKDLFAFIQSSAEQKAVTWKNIENLVRGQSAAYRNIKSAITNIGNRLGADARFVELDAARRDQYFLWNAAARYAEEMGLNPERRVSMGRIGRVPEDVFRYGLRDDLSIGDHVTARRRLEEHFASIPDEEKQAAWRALRASVRNWQPVRVGSKRGEEVREDFLTWAERRLPPEELARIKATDERFRRTAHDLGLFSAPELGRDNPPPIPLGGPRRRRRAPAARTPSR